MTRTPMEMSFKPLLSSVGPSDIPRLIRVKRHVAGLTVRNAAREAGVSHATLSRVENDGQMSLPTYIKLKAWIAGPCPEDVA